MSEALIGAPDWDSGSIFESSDGCSALLWFRGLVRAPVGALEKAELPDLRRTPVIMIR